MKKYQKGDIVIIRFPFSDLTGDKKRPALIISNDTVNKTGDYLMVQITSRIRNDNLSVQINKKDYIADQELPLTSCVRLHKIFLLNENLIISRNTAVKDVFIHSVVNKIKELLD